MNSSLIIENMLNKMNYYILFAISIGKLRANYLYENQSGVYWNYLGQILADSNCGDWLSYGDEKCFTVIDTVVPEAEAGPICQNQKANLGLIRSGAEQDLVYNYLKNKSFADNVWIGIKKENNSFKTIEGASLNYTNWSTG